MFITVAICTWNRASELRTTLTSLSRLAVGDLDWEVVVVNNRSTDHTDAVIAEFSELLPVRRIFEEKPGLSNARNAALEHAGGDVIIFTDDDISFEPNWLLSYCAAFEQYPDVSFFGGGIIPRFDEPPPAWVQEAWRHTKTVFGELLVDKFESFEISRAQTPYGANYAVRVRDHRAIRYDPELGLRHGVVVMGEETAVMTALLDRGHSGRWVKGASVFHRIPNRNASISHVRRYHVGQGVGAARREFERTQWTIGGCPPWMWRAWLSFEFGWRIGRLIRDSECWVFSMTKAAFFLGMLSEHRRLRTTEDGQSSR